MGYIYWASQHLTVSMYVIISVMVYVILYVTVCVTLCVKGCIDIKCRNGKNLVFYFVYTLMYACILLCFLR